MSVADRSSGQGTSNGAGALAASHWIGQRRGHELTALDVQMAYQLASEASDALGQSERVALRIQTMLRPTTCEVR
jgi:hypothetical protein